MAGAAKWVPVKVAVRPVGGRGDAGDRAGDLQPGAHAVIDREDVELRAGGRVHEVRGTVALALAERGDVHSPVQPPPVEPGIASITLTVP